MTTILTALDEEWVNCKCPPELKGSLDEPTIKHTFMMERLEKIAVQLVSATVDKNNLDEVPYHTHKIEIQENGDGNPYGTQETQGPAKW
jgi:hypothetical protein